MPHRVTGRSAREQEPVTWAGATHPHPPSRPARGPWFSEQRTESPVEKTKPVPGEAMFSSTESILGRIQPGQHRETGQEKRARKEFPVSVPWPGQGPATGAEAQGPDADHHVEAHSRGREIRALVLRSHPGTGDPVSTWTHTPGAGADY